MSFNSNNKGIYFRQSKLSMYVCLTLSTQIELVLLLYWDGCFQKCKKVLIVKFWKTYSAGNSQYWGNRIYTDKTPSLNYEYIQLIVGLTLVTNN